MTRIDAALRQRLLAEARRALQSALSKALQETGVVLRPGAVRVACEAAGECFDELVQIKDRRGFDAVRSLTASRISLVHEDDLEFTIRLADLARHLRETCELELSALHARFVSLLEQGDVSDEQMPVGPEATCAALRALVEAGSMDGETRLALLPRCAAPLARELGECYKMLNERFEAAGLRGNRSIRRHDSPGGALHRLRRQLLGSDGAAAEHAPADAGLSSALREQVLRWLEDQQANRVQGGALAAPLNGLAESGLAALLSPGTRASLEAIGRMFEAMKGDGALPSVLKNLLARLQIPLLRLAVLDETVVTREDHPARRLVDGIGELLTGRPAPPALLNRLHGIVSELEHQPPEAAAFGQAANAVEAALNEQHLAVAQAVAPFVEAALREEKREQAVRAASDALAALWDPAPVPQIARFLETYWIKVLIAAHQLRGEDSEAWQHLLDTAATLIDTGRMPSTAEARETLARALPALVRRLNNALASGGMDDAARQQALRPCMDLHAALMRGQPVPEAPPPRPVAPLRWRAVPDLPALRIGRAPDFLTGVVHARIPGNLTLHASFACALPEAGVTQGTVAWVGPERRVALLLSGEGIAAYVLPTRWLAEEVEAGRTTLTAPQTDLFEQLATRAMEKA